MHAAGCLSIRHFLPLALFRNSGPWWLTLCAHAHTLSSACKSFLPNLKCSNLTFKFNLVITLWECMPVSPLTLGFMVYAVRNLLSAAIATFATRATLTLHTSVSPFIWNLTGANLHGRASGASWKLISVSGISRRENKKLCVQLLSGCSLVPQYMVNTYS